MSNLKMKEEVFQTELKLMQTSDSVGYEPAGRGLRTVALFLDTLIVGIMQKLLYVACVYLVVNVMKLELSKFLIPIQCFVVCMLYCYWIGFAKMWGATPGKKMLGLRIVNLDNSLELKTSKLFIREVIGKLFSALILCIGYLRSFFVKDRMTWHDMMSKTKVVKFRN